MKPLLFVILLAVTALSSCQSPKHNGVGVELDNGKKWTANAETTEGINNMIAIIENNADAPELKKQLKDEFNLIFKNCTMKGEAHNQLHNFLLPMKQMIDKIDEEQSNIRQINIKSLSEYLATYKNYFN